MTHTDHMSVPGVNGVKETVSDVTVLGFVLLGKQVYFRDDWTKNLQKHLFTVQQQTKLTDRRHIIARRNALWNNKKSVLCVMAEEWILFQHVCEVRAERDFIVCSQSRIIDAQPPRGNTGASG